MRLLTRLAGVLPLSLLLVACPAAEGPTQTEPPPQQTDGGGDGGTALDTADLCLLTEDELADIFETDAVAIDRESPAGRTTGWCGYRWDEEFLFVVTTTDTPVEQARADYGHEGEDVGGIGNDAFWWPRASLLFVEYDQGVLQLAHVYGPENFSLERQLEIAKQIATLTGERL